MCGRLAFTKTDAKKLKERFALKKAPAGLSPRYNVSPSQPLAVILNESPEEISFARWGLIPHWAKEEKTQYTMINAKAETIAEKPAYKSCLKHKRCLVLADSFYEWKQAKDGKKPYRIFLKSEEPFAMAGIWDLWEKGENALLSCSIITTQANALVGSIHDRMPVILPPEDEAKWLSADEPAAALAYLKPYDAKKMDAYEISTRVNSPRHDEPQLLEPIGK